MKIFLLIIMSFVISLLMYVLFVDIDKATGNNFYKKYIVESDCEYKLPQQYFLVRDSLTGEYAIMFMHLDRFRNFVKVSRHSLISNYYTDMGDAKEAMSFSDSCKAKGFFKMFQVRRLNDNTDRYK